MATLNDLPPELLLTIASYVTPDDTDSLTAISKRVRHALRPVIEIKH